MQHVYIIESPDPAKLLKSQCEGRALAEGLRLSGVGVTYQLAVDLKTFGEAFRAISDHWRAEGANASDLPFIHISAHGDEQGIHLTSDEFFDWEALRDALKDINHAIGYVPHSEPLLSKSISRVSICMSTCKGYEAHQAHGVDTCPFQYVIGPVFDIGWSEALTAFQVFYHCAVYQGNGFKEAVKRMNATIDREEAFQLYESPELDGL